MHQYTLNPRISRNKGFTIVELLIVIVVIAILAALALVSYNGMQKRAIDSRIKSDLSQLTKAMSAARINKNQPLGLITNDAGWYCTDITGNFNYTNPNNIEPRLLPKSSECWVRYLAALNVLSEASGMNLEQLKSGDPRGNPYAIRGVEGRTGPTDCAKDRISIFTGTNANNIDASTINPSFEIPRIQPACAP